MDNHANGRFEMKLIHQTATVEIYEIAEGYGFDYYVYGVTENGDPRVCPSEDMARALAVGC